MFAVVLQAGRREEVSPGQSDQAQEAMRRLLLPYTISSSFHQHEQRSREYVRLPILYTCTTDQVLPLQSRSSSSRCVIQDSPRAAPAHTLPVLQFTTKQLQKQSRKASKDETAEKAKLKKVHPLPSCPLARLSHSRGSDLRRYNRVTPRERVSMLRTRLGRRRSRSTC